MPRTCCRLGRRNRGSGNTAALRKAAQTPTAASRSSGCSNQHRTHYSSRAHPREYTKTKPRGRSRCTSTREAPRNKSRGRADRTLVLGCCGAAAQNAGGRPGLPLNAPDTRRFQPTSHGRKTRPPPGKKKTSKKYPGDERTKGPRAGVWTSRNRRVKRTHMQTFTRAEGLYTHTHPEREE